MMKVFVLLCIAFLVAYASATCTLHEDCGICHTCDEGVCVSVQPLTDPNQDCPTFCGMKMVCGNDPHCVLNGAPECECDWSTSECIVDSTDETERMLPEIGEDDDVIIIGIEEDDEDEREVVKFAGDVTWKHAFAGVLLTIVSLSLVTTTVLVARLIYRMTDDGNSRETTREISLLPDSIKNARTSRLLGKQKRTRRHKPRDSGMMSEVSLHGDDVLYVQARVSEGDNYYSDD